MAWLALHLRLDLVGKSGEGLLDVHCVFGRSLQELDAQGVSEGLSFLGLDLPAGFEIGLVADEQLDDVLIAVLVDLSEPVLDVLEGLAISDVVNKDDAMRSLVVGGSDGLEALLAGSVPDLQLDSAATGLESPDLEVDSDCWEEAE